jgi:hypothetical protein
MTFARLSRGDWVAWVGALCLLLSMALDWYGSEQGDAARRLQNSLQPGSGSIAADEERELKADAQAFAERQERNAFQADGTIDRVILVVLLAAAGLAFAAGTLRAAGRRLEPPGTPSAAAAVAATTGAVLVAYRIVQEPGLDAATTVKLGALAGLVSVSVLALGARAAYRAEREGRIAPAARGGSGPAHAKGAAT